MSAFALFSLKAPSLLACDQERAEGNGHTIDGIERVPCDTPRRELRAPVSPTVLRPVFKSSVRQLQRGKALASMAFRDGHDGLRQRFVHYSHTAHPTAIMGTGVFTKPLAPFLV